MVDVGDEKMRERVNQLLLPPHARTPREPIAPWTAPSSEMRDLLWALCDRVEAAERNERHMRNLHDWRAKEANVARQNALDVEKRAVAAEARVAELEEALRRIAESDPPHGALSWTSGKSWRIELAKETLAGVPVAEEEK